MNHSIGLGTKEDRVFMDQLVAEGEEKGVKVRMNLGLSE